MRAKLLLRRWWRTSNALLALGIVLMVSGAQGVFASANGLLGGAGGEAVPWTSSGSAKQDAGIFLPPTLWPSPTPTPFNEMYPLTGSSEAAVSPEEDATPVWSIELDPGGYAPGRISIPAIHLDAPVVVSKDYQVTLGHQEYVEWAPPNEFAAGWQAGSAPLGTSGNTVLNGHNNEYGDVFGRLEDVQVGDEIRVTSQAVIFHYQVTNRMILLELNQELAIRADNAQWIQPSQDERLTLVTCWPLNGNSHRLIVVARPVGYTFMDTALPASMQ
jgi:LPXTG-site transpeptidase (sortase) family protein